MKINRGSFHLSVLLVLIGLLSIERFRIPIKDTLDMVFLFWVIAIGLGADTYNWGVVVVSSFIIMLLVLVLHPVFRAHQRGVIIFEIKCDKSQPHWLRELVQTQGLRFIANSKFTQGIESSRPEVLRPSWSY